MSGSNSVTSAPTGKMDVVGQYVNKNEDCLNAEKIISMGIDYLEALIGKQDKNYRCVSYRGGGSAFSRQKSFFNCCMTRE